MDLVGGQGQASSSALPLPPGMAPSALSLLPASPFLPNHALVRLGHALASAGSSAPLAARETGMTEIPLPFCWVSSVRGASSWWAQRSAEAQQKQGLTPGRKRR